MENIYLRRNENGMTLLSVLITLAVLSSISILLTSKMVGQERVFRSQSNFYLHRLAEKEAVDIFRITIASKLNSEGDHSFFRGELFPIKTSYGTVNVQAYDVGGLIDSNLAPKEMLDKLGEKLNIVNPGSRGSMSQNFNERIGSIQNSTMAEAIPAEKLSLFSRFTSVSNGFPTLNPDTVPDELLFLLSDKKSRDAAIKTLPKSWFEKRPIQYLQFYAYYEAAN